jgi:hypothetical protein
VIKGANIMSDYSIKLEQIKRPLAVCAVVTLFLASYIMDRSAPIIVVYAKHEGKTLEEIMHQSVPQTNQAEWDTEFKSQIIPGNE